MHRFSDTVSALVRLGSFFESPDLVPDDLSSRESIFRAKHGASFAALIASEHIHNPWFTPDNVRRSLSGIARMLEESTLLRWLDAYPGLTHDRVPKNVGLVLAGNIPLVGFHDLLCVLVSGHNAIIKPSSKDERLMRSVCDMLADLDPSMEKRIRIREEKLGPVDAVIATGSNNSARYFESYFKDIPHLIRRNRNGVAVLTGEETEQDFESLGRDIFTYFGLGCRNVAKLYVPGSFDLTRLLAVLDRFVDLAQHNKYGNNVDYHRSVFLMNRIDFLDNGVLLLKEDPSIAAPVGVVHYERYDRLFEVRERLEVRSEEVQCCVSIHPDIPGAIAPGTTQEPMPWDYADGVDTLSFLMQLT